MKLKTMRLSNLGGRPVRYGGKSTSMDLVQRFRVSYYFLSIKDGLLAKENHQCSKYRNNLIEHVLVKS